MGRLRTYISPGLMLVFTIILIPNEYIHLIYGHEDTHHVFNSDPTFENHHHHCQILSHRFSIFLNDYRPLTASTQVYYRFVAVSLYQAETGQVHYNLSPRSPPLFL